MSAEATGDAATRDHVERLIEKRDRLDALAREALDAFASSIARSDVTPADAIALWEWSRTLGLTGASERVAVALGTSIGILVDWRDNGCPATGGSSYAGAFPVDRGAVPRKGTPTVYVLFDTDDRVVYIGQSQNARVRLRTHWRDPTKVGLARWWLMVCADAADMVVREADLIREHQPLLNIAGRESA